MGDLAALRRSGQETGTLHGRGNESTENGRAPMVDTPALTASTLSALAGLEDRTQDRSPRVLCFAGTDGLWRREHLAFSLCHPCPGNRFMASLSRIFLRSHLAARLFLD